MARAERRCFSLLHKQGYWQIDFGDWGHRHNGVGGRRPAEGDEKTTGTSIGGTEKPLDDLQSWTLLRIIHCPLHCCYPIRCGSQNVIPLNILRAENGINPGTVLSAIFHEGSGENLVVAIRLYRGPLLLVEFLFLIGVNVYGWRSYGVNHVLIFELDPRNHLSDQDLMEIAAILGVVWTLRYLFPCFCLNNTTAPQLPIPKKNEISSRVAMSFT